MLFRVPPLSTIADYSLEAHTFDFRPFSSIRLDLSPCMLTLGEAIAPQDKRHNFAHVFGCSVPGLMDGVLEYLEMHDRTVELIAGE